VGFRCVQSRVSVKCITVLLSEAAGIIEPRASSRISELGTSDALGDAPRFFNSDPDPDPLRGRVSCKENNQLTKLITLIKEAVLSSEDASHLVFYFNTCTTFPNQGPGSPARPSPALNASVPRAAECSDIFPGSSIPVEPRTEIQSSWRAHTRQDTMGSQPCRKPPRQTPRQTLPLESGNDLCGPTADVLPRATSPRCHRRKDKEWKH